MSMVVVFGALNIDLMMKVDHQPQIGETIVTPTYEWLPGGKGANQAIACSRFGIKTAMVGQVGDDGFGTRILNRLKRDEVLASGVARHDHEPTGMAFVTINPEGENQIVVAAGANGRTNARQVPDEILGEDNVVLMQMEIDHAQNWDVIRRAKEHGAKTILNLAPSGSVPKDVLVDLDYLIVNELEGVQMAEKMGLNIEKDAVKLAATLASHADLICIMTLGAKGAIAMKPNGAGWRVDAMDLGDRCVDTTGAGDTFCGVFAGCVFEKRSVQESVRRASIAGGLACRGVGAQTTMPRGSEIEEYLEEIEMPVPITAA